MARSSREQLVIIEGEMYTPYDSRMLKASRKLATFDDIKFGIVFTGVIYANSNIKGGEVTWDEVLDLCSPKDTIAERQHMRAALMRLYLLSLETKLLISIHVEWIAQEKRGSIHEWDPPASGKMAKNGSGSGSKNN
jgi:hypothetical protein